MSQCTKATRLENRAADVLLQSTDGVRCRVFSSLCAPSVIPAELWVARNVPSMPAVPNVDVSPTVLLIDPLTWDLIYNATIELEHDDQGRVTAVFAQEPSAAQAEPK